MRERDETGGMWIGIGVAGGVVLYVGTIIMLIAGFTAIAPFVIIPPVVLVLMAANGWLGGPRRPRLQARPINPTDSTDLISLPSPSGDPVANGHVDESSLTDGPSKPNGGDSASSG